MGTNGLTTRARLQLINIFVKTKGKFQKTGLIPNGLKIKNSSAITPVSEDFNTKWNEVLYNAGKKLVELLLYESSKVIAKIQVELDLEVRKTDPENYDRIYEKLNAKHARFRRGLEERRGKKCEKVKAHKNVFREVRRRKLQNRNRKIPGIVKITKQGIYQLRLILYMLLLPESQEEKNLCRCSESNSNVTIGFGKHKQSR